MNKKTPTVGLVVTAGGITLQAFVVPYIETAKDHLMQPSKLAEVNVQRHLEGFLPEGPESETRPVQTRRGIVVHGASATSTHSINLSSGTYQGMRWWLPQSIKFQ